MCLWGCWVREHIWLIAANFHSHLFYFSLEFIFVQFLNLFLVNFIFILLLDLRMALYHNLDWLAWLFEEFWVQFTQMRLARAMFELWLAQPTRRLRLLRLGNIGYRLKSHHLLLHLLLFGHTLVNWSLRWRPLIIKMCFIRTSIFFAGRHHIGKLQSAIHPSPLAILFVRFLAMILSNLLLHRLYLILQVPVWYLNQLLPTRIGFYFIVFVHL